MDAKRHAQPNMRLCAPLAGHVVPLEISTFLSNEQVSVVTRSSPRSEVARGPSASPRLLQDGDIIAKNESRGGTACSLTSTIAASIVRTAEIIIQYDDNG